MQLDQHFAPQPPFFIGVDVGGTGIKIGLVDDLGTTLGKSSIPTHADQPVESALARVKIEIERLVHSLEDGYPAVAAIGLGTPGPMDIPNGLILNPTNLPAWRNFPIRDRLAEMAERPVSFANDANAAAFGEYWIGSGSQFNSVVMLTLGTGVGGGIVFDGRPIVGETSHGGECGHVVVDTTPEARVCSCGHRGHLEAYASATAIINRCREALQTNQESLLAGYLAEGKTIDGLAIANAAESGDELANELILETANYLGVGVSIFLTTIDPAAVILGGAMNFGGESHPVGKRFIERVRQVTRKMVLPVVADHAKIRFALLGGDAGYIGAAGMAREDHYRRQN